MELLIVIVIIAILAAITIIAYNGITQKAHTTVLTSDLSQNSQQLGVDQAQNGSYPADQSSAGLKASSGDTLTYVPGADGTSFCLQATGYSQTYHVTNDDSSPQSGACPLNGPIVVGAGTEPDPVHSGSVTITTNPNTKEGDLVVITGYFGGATIGTFGLPSGVTNESGFPIETDPGGGNNDSYLAVLYYYAQANGSESLTFTNTADDVWWGLNSVTIEGGPTSGDPFADTPVAAASYDSSATTTPAVSMNLGGANSLVLWVFVSWDGSINLTTPSGYDDVYHDGDQPFIAQKTYASAGSTGSVFATLPSGALTNSPGMAAALLSFR